MKAKEVFKLTRTQDIGLGFVTLDGDGPVNRREATVLVLEVMPSALFSRREDRVLTKTSYPTRGYPAEASSTVPPSLLKSDRLDEFNGLWTRGWLGKDMKPLSLIWSRGTASP